MRWRVFTFWLNLVWFLLYIKKTYRKISSAVLLRKDLQLIYLQFSFEKHVPSQVLKDFSVENLETTRSIFLSKFSSEIYLSRIINHWGSSFTLYLMWGAFSLVCVLSIFFFFFSLFFFFSFSVGIFLTDTNDSQDSRDVEEIIIFLTFNFHLLRNIHLAHRDFYHFFLTDLSVITRLIAHETCSLSRFVIYLFFHWWN